MKKVLHVFLSTLVLLGISHKGEACTDIVVGKKASADGSVIISHTDAGQDCRIRVVPGRTFKKGEMAPVYWGIQSALQPLNEYGEVLGHIPQVEKTFTYFHSAYSQMNEFQLAIAESTMSQRDELILDKGEGDQIMAIEQAQIFALQRCSTAREAVELIGHLVETYGFLPSCVGGSEALCIGDPNEAWIFEAFSVGKGWNKDSGKPGAIWAAQRVPDDHVTLVPNWSIIKQIDIKDTKNFMASSNYMQEAIDRGWYDPNSGFPFVWQEAYSPMAREWATGRFWLFFTTFAPNYREWPDRSLDNPWAGVNQYYQYVEPLSIYPFSVKPEKPVSVQDIMAFQRSTFKGTIYDKEAAPQWYIPDGKGGMKLSPMATPFPNRDLRQLLNITYRRNVARGHGEYGAICQLRSELPDAIGGVYWIFLDNAYISPYVPLYSGNLDVAEPYKTYDPNHYSDKSARWVIDFVDNLANIKYQEAIKDLKEVRDPFEEKIFSKQAEIEKKALELYQKNPQKAKEFLTDYSKGLMNEVPPMYIKIRNTLLEKYTNNHE